MESVVVAFIAEQRYLCDVRQVREGVTGIGGVGLKVLPRFWRAVLRPWRNGSRFSLGLPNVRSCLYSIPASRIASVNAVLKTLVFWSWGEPHVDEGCHVVCCEQLDQFGWCSVPRTRRTRSRSRRTSGNLVPPGVVRHRVWLFRSAECELVGWLQCSGHSDYGAVRAVGRNRFVGSVHS